jgi:hypothetical protein
MVLRIWLMVLVFSTLYYCNRLYGDSITAEVEMPAGYSYKLNYDD